MSKQTLMQQWEQLEARIEAISREFIEQYYSGKERPTAIYWLQSYQGIVEQEVTKISLYRQGRPLLLSKRPTKTLIDDLWSWSQSFVPIEDDIRIHYQYRTDDHVASGAHKLSDIDGKRLSYEKNTLFTDLQELKDKYEPRPGHEACAYCRKQAASGRMVSYTVIARQYPGMKKTSLYCSQQCGAYDQMAHEG